MIPVKNGSSYASMSAILSKKLTVDWTQLQSPKSVTSPPSSQPSVTSSCSKENGNKNYNNGTATKQHKPESKASSNFSGSLFLSSPDPTEVPPPNFDREADVFAGHEGFLSIALFEELGGVKYGENTTTSSSKKKPKKKQP